MVQFNLKSLFVLLALSSLVAFAYVMLARLLPPTKPPTYDRPVTKHEVIEISKWIVSQNESWPPHNARYEVSADDNGWYVVVWRLPQVIGGHRSIKLDEFGEFVSYDY